MSKYFLGLVLASTSILAMLQGCGGDEKQSTSGSGAASSSSSSSSSGAGASGGAAGAGGGGMPDPNISCDTAEPLEQMLAIGPTLEPVDSDEDFYTFDGTAGELFLLLTDSKPDTDEFDSTYPDLVVTLYKNNNGAWEQVAQNDDPTPRYSNDSELWTVLEEGKYCLRVTECNKLFPGLCSPAADITTFDYGVAGLPIDPAKFNSIFTETEPNDNPPGDPASPVEYEKSMSGGYYQSIGYGAFANADDRDVFSFTVPTDVAVSEGRATCNFDFYPTGTSGNGSTADTGILAYVTTEADPNTTIAMVDVTMADPKSGSLPGIGMPCTFGTKYLFWFERGGVTAGKNDFYVFTHSGGGSNPLEAETEAMPNTNDKATTAEKMPMYDNMDGSFSYFIDGDLVPASADMDVFAIDIPAGSTIATVSVACGAQRLGSGLRGFRATVLDDKENQVGMAISTESDGSDAQISDIAVPAGATRLYLKLEATSQAPDVTSSFYRCGVHLAPPNGG